MLYMIGKLLLAGLTAVTVIIVAVIAFIIGNLIGWVVACWMPMPTPAYAAVIVGGVAFYFTLAYGAEYAARKGFF
jgi:hypothetical protein